MLSTRCEFVRCYQAGDVECRAHGRVQCEPIELPVRLPTAHCPPHGGAGSANNHLVEIIGR